MQWQVLKREIKRYSIEFSIVVAEKRHYTFKLLAEELERLNTENINNEQLQHREEILAQLDTVY